MHWKGRKGQSGDCQNFKSSKYQQKTYASESCGKWIARLGKEK